MAPIVKTPVVDRSGSITAGGTAQDVYISTNAPRFGLEFYNTSTEKMYLDWGCTATSTSGIPLEPGEGWIPPEGIVPVGNLSVLCAVTGATFICKNY